MNAALMSYRERLARWLLPFAGEHGYRDVTGERFRFTRWVAYWLWKAT